MKPDKEKERRNQRVVIVVTPSQKRKWLSVANRNHWTLTTLVEVAVSEYLDNRESKVNTSEQKRKLI